MCVDGTAIRWEGFDWGDPRRRTISYPLLFLFFNLAITSDNIMKMWADMHDSQETMSPEQNTFIRIYPPPAFHRPSS